jgi:hypothetical protein
MAVESVLASNQALGLALTATIIAIGVANRSYLRDVGDDPEPFWRVAARLALVAGAAFVAWTTVFDNWRQLTALPYRLAQRFPSKRVELDPPSAGVRTVTLVLLAVVLLLLACLVGRHVGGYLLQAILLAGSLVLWAPLFVIRQRLNLNLAFGFGGSWTSPVDVLGYGLFVALAWLFDMTLILISVAALLTLAALPVTLALDLIRQRQPRVTTEATAFFGALSERAEKAGGRR